MNTLLTLAFNGGAYHGFQVQQNAITVCEVLQDAMERLFGTRPDVKGSSRTDAGVHAEGFCVSFCHTHNVPYAKLGLALNSFLPPDIRVLHAKRVPQAFHARYSALGKTYEYRILNRAVDDPFLPGQYYRYAKPLDIGAMRKAAGHIVGKRDFASFMSAGSTVEDTVRTVQALEVGKRGDMVVISITADGFLYNMVRIIAGTLLAVGDGRMAADDVAGVVAACERSRAGDTLPARGLFLCRVHYAPEALAYNGADEATEEKQRVDS